MEIKIENIWRFKIIHKESNRHYNFVFVFPVIEKENSFRITAPREILLWEDISLE